MFIAICVCVRVCACVCVCVRARGVGLTKKRDDILYLRRVHTSVRTINVTLEDTQFIVN
jgi:hypothetical protein